MGKYIILERRKKIYSDLSKWLKAHDSVFPRQSICINGKVLRKGELTEEQEYEVKLARNWITYSRRDTEMFAEYMKLKLEDVPKEYRIIVQALQLKEPLKGRSYIKMLEMFDEIIEWLDKNNQKMPRSIIIKNKKRFSRGELSKEELEEVNLYERWIKSPAREILIQYTDVPLEEIPERYREYISKMRAFGYGYTEENCFEEIIEWLEEHQNKLPCVQKMVPAKDMTKDEEYETSLRKRWDRSEEKEILEEYVGRPIKEVPKEYREKIQILRDHGLGLNKKDIEKAIFDWLKIYGTLPRKEVRILNQRAKRNYELTKAESHEVRLRRSFERTELKKVLEQYAGRGLEEVPEEYREKIAILRSYGLGREKIEHADIFEQIIKWLKSHDGKFPRSAIMTGKRSVKLVKDMTRDERYELSISQRWFRSKEREIYLSYMERPIEEVPKEYREKIQLLRDNVVDYQKKIKDVRNNHFERLILWLNENNNRIPKSDFKRDGKRISTENLTPEQLYEVRLYTIWKKSDERRILNEYAGRPIEEVPEKFREKNTNIETTWSTWKKSR